MLPRLVDASLASSTTANGGRRLQFGGKATAGVAYRNCDGRRIPGVWDNVALGNFLYPTH